MRKTLSVVTVAAASALVLAGCAPAENYSFDTVSEPEATLEVAPAPTVTVTETVAPDAFDEVVGETEVGPAEVDETALLLTYLIEEEKLAHDVYTVLYEEYGSKVFGNILKSEAKHQDQVLNLLDDFGVEDPRSSEVGVFNDPELQALYDTLIEKGMLSEQDAFEVGVMIEEKDIADITSQLASASDESVITTLEKLRSGSENHLRAFNRQL